MRNYYELNWDSLKDRPNFKKAILNRSNLTDNEEKLRSLFQKLSENRTDGELYINESLIRVELLKLWQEYECALVLDSKIRNDKIKKTLNQIITTTLMALEDLSDFSLEPKLFRVFDHELFSVKMASAMKEFLALKASCNNRSNEYKESLYEIIRIVHFELSAI